MDELWPRYGLEFTGQARDWDVAFGRAAPLVVEIGFGNGEALATCAAADPVRNYLGLEVHTPGVGRLLRSVAAAALRNVRVLRHDAVAVIDDEIPNGGIAELRIWFPDPWPKKRHHKRRLIQPEFLARIRPKLAIGGLLHLATDWQPYAEHMLECLSAAPGYANTVTAGYAPRPESRPLTHFEQRGQRLGHGVWDLLWRRVG